MDKPWYAQAKPYRSNWTAFLALIWFNGAESVYATDPLYLWKAVKRACDVGIPEWCTKYRMQTNSPPVTVLLNGKQLTDEYRLVKDSSVGKLRPFLEELKRCGYIYGFDWKTKTLKVDR